MVTLTTVDERGFVFSDGSSEPIPQCYEVWANDDIALNQTGYYLTSRDRQSDNAMNTFVGTPKRVVLNHLEKLLLADAKAIERWRTMKFNRDDLVRLCSGGPTMMVFGVMDDGRVMCKWPDGPVGFWGAFVPESLVLVAKEVAAPAVLAPLAVDEVDQCGYSTKGPYAIRIIEVDRDDFECWVDCKLPAPSLTGACPYIDTCHPEFPWLVFVSIVAFKWLPAQKVRISLLYRPRLVGNEVAAAILAQQFPGELTRGIPTPTLESMLAEQADEPAIVEGGERGSANAKT